MSEPLLDPVAVQRRVETVLKVGWAIITDAGLPHDADDPRVKRVWGMAWNCTDVQTAYRIMLQAAHDEAAGIRCDRKREAKLQRLRDWLNGK